RAKKDAGSDKKATWMGMGGDRVKEVTWINLSRAPRFVGYYYSSMLDPIKYKNESYRVPPEMSGAIKEMSEKVFRPYGKMIRKLEVSPRRSAVLVSLASYLYGKTINHGQGTYGNYRTLPFQVVMEMAHYNADVLFDESIEKGDLDNYDVLFLPRCDTLTQTAYQKIQDFQKRGGLVYADQYLGPELDVVHRFDFDFAYRRKVNAAAINKGITYAEWDDHVASSENIKMEKTSGVPADKDQEIMEGFAKTFKNVVSEKVPHLVDCDTPTVLFNLCESNGIRYLFVINDKRTYGERVGKFRGIMEKSVPQKVTVRLHDKESAPQAVYDLLSEAELPITQEDGFISFPVDLDALGGKIIALYPNKLEKISVSPDKESNKLGEKSTVEINISSDSDSLVKGLQPLRVDIIDPQGNSHEDSDWICIENGKGTFSFTPAWNDPAGEWTVQVKDLTAGLTSKTSLSFKN
ncbi:MAG: hypothetical protein ACK5LK_02625, partial [Chthoniobacterales bacterium]